MALTLTTDERTELERRVRSLKIRSEDARRARVILMLATASRIRRSKRRSLAFATTSTGGVADSWPIASTACGRATKGSRRRCSRPRWRRGCSRRHANLRPTAARIGVPGSWDVCSRSITTSWRRAGRRLRARVRSFEECRVDRSTGESACRSSHDRFFSILLASGSPALTSCGLRRRCSLGNQAAFYFNVHTAANPGGVMRGQLVKQ